MSPVLLGMGVVAALAALGRPQTNASPAPPPGGGGSSGGASGPPEGPPAGGGSSGGGGGGDGRPRPSSLYPPFPFPGRAKVLALAAGEAGQGAAPRSRDAAVLRWLAAGELDAPKWARIPVRGGLEVAVTSDDVKMGGVRVCCSQIAGQRIADAWGVMMITAGISDAIWKAATLRLGPFPLSAPNVYGVNPGGGVRYWLEEDDAIEARLVAAKAKRAAELGIFGVLSDTRPDLVAGTSKDYTLTSRLIQRPDRLSIYGWHLLDGHVIQPEELAHELTFFDYSHRVRLVSRDCWLDGKLANLADIYQHRPELVTRIPGEPAPPIRHPGVPL